MMLKPSIDSLLERIPSKYSLVILASKRAHELDEGAQATLETFESVKSVGQALEEIDANTVVVEPDPEGKRARLAYEAELKRQQKELEQKELEARIRQEQPM